MILMLMQTGARASSWTAASDIAFQPAAHFKPLIDRVYSELCARYVVACGRAGVTFIISKAFCTYSHAPWVCGVQRGPHGMQQDVRQV